MRVLTPETDPLWPHADIFLAGSITGRPDWQARAIELIAASAPDLTVANPRPRRAIPSYRREARARIAWEHDHLMRARLVLFWLTADRDVRPLDLLELGAALGRGQDIVIGVDPDSPHRLDIVILTALECPRLTIHTTLEALVDAAIHRAAGALMSRALSASHDPIETTDHPTTEKGN